MQKGLGSGDRLARGAVSAAFPPMGEGVSRTQWAERVEGKVPEVTKAFYVFTCPVHGQFESKVECFLSGGYPLFDTYKTGKCADPDCDEKCECSGFVKIEA